MTRRTIPRGPLVLSLGLLMGGWGTLGTAPAQSLAELAKKEKERRAHLPGKKGRVITDQDLAGYSGLPTTPAPEGEASAASAAPGDGAAGAEQAAAPDATKTREHWQSRVLAVQKKIGDLETELQSPELNWGQGINMAVNPIGQNNLQKRQDIERRLVEARAELEQVRDEARRAGVPAGWVR
jgi:hypothetical protein